jgi:hypothetical protein
MVTTLVFAMLLSGSECMVSLRLPKAEVFAYEPSGGDIVTTVTIDSRGAGKAASTGGSSSQQRDIAEAISDSRFDPKCAVRRVVLVFEYKFGEGKSDRERVTHEFHPPNKFRLILTPLIPQIFKTP